MCELVERVKMLRGVGTEELDLGLRVIDPEKGVD